MNSSSGNNTPIRTIDLFCGAGGSSYGARLAGAEIVVGFDLWQPAVDTYNTNFGQGKARCEDIFALNPETLSNELGKIDLLLASPECTNHSRAKGKGIRCERSRETALQVVRFARVLKPQWVVIENVIEMQQWSRHQELRGELEKLGYHCSEETLDAQDFGTPQSRRRLFMLCSLYEKPEKLVPVQSEKRTAREIISANNGYKLTPLRIQNRALSTLAKVDYALKQMEEAEKKLEPFLVVYYGSAKEGGNGGWQSLDRPLRTITTLDRFGYVVPGSKREEDKMRMLQPEELKRAMGYGSDFQFASGLTRRDKIKLMGNGVCPPIMHAIVESLTKQQEGRE